MTIEVMRNVHNVDKKQKIQLFCSSCKKTVVYMSQVGAIICCTKSRLHVAFSRAVAPLNKTHLSEWGCTATALKLYVMHAIWTQSCGLLTAKTDIPWGNILLPNCPSNVSEKQSTGDHFSREAAVSVN